jgi:large subunit ribosomal protein L17
MRHLKAGRKLGRTSSHRKALFRNMVTSLFEHERLQTTDAKAKEVRRVAEKLITLGKRGDLGSRRRALSYIHDKGVVHKLFTEISPRFEARPGGYTRIMKLGNRQGDNAPISVLELVQEAYVPRPNKQAPAPKAAATPPAAKVETAPVQGEGKSAAAEPAVPDQPVEEQPVAEGDA